MPRKTFNYWFALPIAIVLPFILSAQSPTPPQSQVLLVNGQPGKTTVVHVNGKTYIDVEALAQVGNGSFTIKDNQITLIIPPPPSAPPASRHRRDSPRTFSPPPLNR